MPLNDGEIFAGFRIIRLLGSGAWVMSTSLSTQGCRAVMPSKSSLQTCPPTRSTAPDSTAKPT
jgi:hypothetical protein